MKNGKLLSDSIKASLEKMMPMSDKLLELQRMDRLELRRNRNQSPPVITVTDEIPAHMLKMIEEKKKKVQAYLEKHKLKF